MTYGRRQDFFLGNTSKILKDFHKQIAKMHYFSIFFKQFNKACVKFLRGWTKNANCLFQSNLSINLNSIAGIDH